MRAEPGRQRRCNFVKLTGIVSALVAVALLALTALASLATGLQVWLAQNPAWPWFKTSLAALACAGVLTLILLGREFGWWSVDGQSLDHLGAAWIGVTVAVAALTYWLVR